MYKNIREQARADDLAGIRFMGVPQSSGPSNSAKSLVGGAALPSDRLAIMTG
ncbi:hypothetical protein [Bradyrhizobium sp. CCBAU 53340]|uniref:hypothetical protein n=1 Tax=Bradyrhizobium sp. CCBAU 53340 TaxID=1325112 RepID=UPI001AEE6C1E|nr:hypothetical protein [Bradyrhizobium sp. CCBAU 53340]